MSSYTIININTITIIIIIKVVISIIIDIGNLLIAVIEWSGIEATTLSICV